MTLPLDIGPVRDSRGPIKTEPAALLMRLGLTALRGSNPRSSAPDLLFLTGRPAMGGRFHGSALASPHKARTPDPREDDMTDVPDAPVADLDNRRVGEMLMKLPAVAAYLRHESVQSTLGYVWPISDGRESEFIRDLFTKPLGAVLDKWYGGRFHAAELAAGVMNAALKDLTS